MRKDRENEERQEETEGDTVRDIKSQGRMERRRKGQERKKRNGERQEEPVEYEKRNGERRRRTGRDNNTRGETGGYEEKKRG